MAKLVKHKRDRNDYIFNIEVANSANPHRDLWRNNSYKGLKTKARTNF